MNPIATQRSFLRGLNAGTDKFDQPRGSLPRISNMLYDSRGSLRAIDGADVIFSDASGSAPPYFGQIVSVALFQATGVAPFYTFMQIDPGTPLTTPVGLALADANDGAGVLIPGNTYGYRVSALDGVGGETLACATVSKVLGGGMNAIDVTWTAVTNSAGYRVYGRTAGGELLIADNVATNSYRDLGVIVPAGALPVGNTTTQLVLFKPSGLSTYARPGDVIAAFGMGSVPAINSPTPPVNPPSGGTGGGPPIGSGGTGGGVTGCPVEGSVVRPLGPYPLTIELEDASTWIEATAENGCIIEAVPEHPVFSVNRGQIALSLVEIGAEEVITELGVSRCREKITRIHSRRKLRIYLPEGHLYWAGREAGKGWLSHNLKPLTM